MPKVCSRLRFQNFRALLLVQALSLRGCFIESLPPFWSQIKIQTTIKTQKTVNGRLGQFRSECPINFSLSRRYDKLKLIGHQTGAYRLALKLPQPGRLRCLFLESGVNERTSQSLSKLDA
jgi:hypothetical protein